MPEWPKARIQFTAKIKLFTIAKQLKVTLLFHRINKYCRKSASISTYLQGYVQNFETELVQILRANDYVLFERRAYFESLARHHLQPTFTSLAGASDASSMPPPAIPSVNLQSPSSVLSSISGGGPASGSASTLAASMVQLSPASASANTTAQVTSGHRTAGVAHEF